MTVDRVNDVVIRRFITLKLLVLCKPGAGCWESYSEGSSIRGSGQTPDDAVKDFETKMKEGNPDTRVREVVQYVPKNKVVEVSVPVPVETLAEAPAEVVSEEPKKVVFKKRGRPAKAEADVPEVEVQEEMFKDLLEV